MRTMCRLTKVGFLISILFVGTAEGQLEYKFYWTGADVANNNFTTPGNWDHLNPYGDPLVSPSNFYPRDNIKTVDSGDPRDDNYSGTQSYVTAYAGAIIDFTGFNLADNSKKKIRRTFLGGDSEGLGNPIVFNINGASYTTTDKFFVGDGITTDGADAIVNVNGNGHIAALRDHATDGGIVLGQNGYDGTLIMNDSSTSELRSVRLGINGGSVGKIHVNDNVICTIGVYWSMQQRETVFTFGTQDSFIELNDNAKLVVRGDRVGEITNYHTFGLVRDGSGRGLLIEYVPDNFGQVNPDFGYPTGWTHVSIVPEMDSDNDGVPDHQDLCPNTPLGVTVDANGCPSSIPGDFDNDGDVDQNDFGIFQRCLSGDGIAAAPDCAG